MVSSRQVEREILRNLNKNKTMKETKRFARGTDHPREQTTRPDLRRLTRRILQVAELLPWPVKDGLSHTEPLLPKRAVNGAPSFLEGTVLNQRTDGLTR